MKERTLKSLLISFCLLFASQVSAQDNDSSTVDNSTSATCVDFPKCMGVGGKSDADAGNIEQESKWFLLWEELTNEMKETIENLSLSSKTEY